MVRGSGLRTKLAVSAQIVLAVAATTASATGCVYFNSLYNANQLFDRGRKEIERGNTGSGRSTLGQSIEKAERILERSPNSRWADDAQRLIAHARILREEWEEAADASRKLLIRVESARDSAVAVGFLGIAEVRLGNSAAGDSLLTVALGEKGGDKWRARLLYNRALARVSLGEIAGAEEDLRGATLLESSWVTPRIDRTRLLMQQNRGDEAAFELARILDAPPPRNLEDTVYVLAEYMSRSDPEAARVALTNVTSARINRISRARLLKLRGDLYAAAELFAEAEDDYKGVIEMAPDSRWAVEAYLERTRIELVNVARIEEFARPMELLREAVTLPYGTRVAAVNEVLNSIRRVEFFAERGDLAYIAAAEVALHELRANRLARHFYLTYVEVLPDDFWTPKAVLAALELTELDSAGTNGELEGPTAEELRQLLFEDYRDTAYVQALLGEKEAEGFTYEQLEDGLRRQLDRLGLQAEQALKDPRRASNRP